MSNESILEISNKMIKLTDDLELTKKCVMKENYNRRDDHFKITESASLQTERISIDVHQLATEFKGLTQKHLENRYEEEVTNIIRDISDKINLFSNELEYIDSILTS